MTTGFYLFKLYLHADSPCTPDDGTQVADGDTVADTVGLLVALAADGGGNKADAVDDAVTLNEGRLAGLNILDGAALVGYLGDG